MNVKGDKKHLKKWLLAVGSAVMVTAFSMTSWAATGVNVATPSEEAIRSYVNSNGDLSALPTYVTQPDITGSPIKMGDQGELTQATQEQGLKMLKNIRYIAGLSTDVELSETEMNKAQAGAFLNDVNDTMSHEPVKPSNMNQDLYDLGRSGTTSANLSSASWQRSMAEITLGWTHDERGSNLASVGHRRWLLNPSLKYVGFGNSSESGYVYSAICCHDMSGTATASGVVWPAQTMPVDYFGNNIPWSISVGRSVSNVTVTLTREGDGKTWTFGPTVSASTSGTGDYFTVNNEWYGVTGCIIFRPANIEYHVGDKFHVKVTGGANIEYDVNFMALIPVTDLTIPESMIVAPGRTRKLSATVTPSNASDRTITWTSSDPTVATVDKSGNVTGIKRGEVTITAKCGDITKESTVTVGIDLSAATVTIPTGTKYYTGQPVVPEPKVTRSSTVLEKGTAYKVEYKNNVDSKAVSGVSAEITITGIGDYVGTITKTFDIAQSPFNTSLITASAVDTVYTGSEIDPQISVFYKKGTDLEKTLVADQDYTVTAAGRNVDASTATEKATYTVTGKNNFASGSITVTCNIAPADISEATFSDVPALTYNGSAQSPVITAAFGGKDLVEGRDYTMSLESNVNAGTGKAILTGTGNFTGTKELSFTINPMQLKDSGTGYYAQAGDISDQDYTGSGLEPDVAVWLKNGVMQVSAFVQGTDYTVTYESNVNCGTNTAVATITGKNNLTGTVTRTFSIVPVDMSKVTAEAADRTYNGKADATDVTVTWGEKVLTEGTDYEVVYPTDASQYTNAGQVTVTINGKGNYTGSTQATYTIKPCSISEAGYEVELSDDSKKYIGEAITDIDVSCFIKKDGSTAEYLNSTDFDYSFENNVNVGTAKVVVTGKGNYCDSVETTFAITPMQLTDRGTGYYAEAGNIADQNYTGSGLEPAVTVWLKNGASQVSAFVQGTDYTVTYENNVNCGQNTATATITGQNNLTGTVTRTFTILPGDISKVNVTAADRTYDGSAQMTVVTAVSGEKGLEEGKDYEVSYPTDTDLYTNAGQVTLTITGEGNFTGSTSVTYQITPKSLDDATVTAAVPADGYDYTGQAIEPEVQVTSLETTLARDKDYTLTYAGNVSAGTASYTVTGIGNFTGTRTGNFTINGVVVPETEPTQPSEPAQPSQQTPTVTTPPTDPSVITAEAVETSILASNNDNDPAFSTFGLLQAKWKKITKNSIKIGWKRVPGASSYVIYGAPCGQKYQKLTTVTGTSFTQKKLKKGKYYKYLVVAVSSNGEAVATAKTLHIATKGSKLGNDKKVTLNKTKTTLKVGKSFALKAKAVPVAGAKVKRHRKLAYESANPAIATVNKKGKIKAVGKGTCYVYAYAQDGIFAKIKVTVK